MLSIIWAGMLMLAFCYAALTGKLDLLGASVVSSAQNAVSLIMLFVAVIPFWNGIMNIAAKVGITKALSKLLSPLLKRLFPNSFENAECAEAISMNVAANMIGIGNAATPFGLKAVGEMKKRCDNGRPDSEMIKFIVLNSASIQLIPTTVAAMRQRAGAAAPFDIVPAVLICSATGLAAGLAAASLFGRISEHRLYKGTQIWHI